MTRDQWIPKLRRMVDHVRADPASIGVLSMGEQCAVALVLEPWWKRAMPNTEIRPAGYTWLDCVHRIEPELLAACIVVQREEAGSA